MSKRKPMSLYCCLFITTTFPPLLEDLITLSSKVLRFLRAWDWEAVKLLLLLPCPQDNCSILWHTFLRNKCVFLLIDEEGEYQTYSLNGRGKESRTCPIALAPLEYQLDLSCYQSDQTLIQRCLWDPVLFPEALLTPCTHLCIQLLECIKALRWSLFLYEKIFQWEFAYKKVKILDKVKDICLLIWTKS